MSDEPLPAEACQTIADVRAGIDALDARLVRLMAKRQSYIEAAGRIKTVRTAVRDSARIEQVVANVVRYASAAGLSREIAEPVWRELIERSIEHEFRAWDARNAKE